MRPSVLRRISSTVPAVAVAVVLAACSSTPESSGPEDDTAQRVAAITETRAAVVEPAQGLGTATAAVAARLDDVVEQPDEDGVAALRAAVTDLGEARTDVEQVDLEPTTQDVRAAAGALDEAVEGARTMAEAGTVVATVADQAIRADAALGDLVATWDEPGSRSELIARLEETALAADALAGEGIGMPPEECAGPIDARIAAATHVADASRELRELVEARDGLGFDERRAELADVPLGEDEDGAARELGAPIDADGCPAVADAEASATQVVEALQDLQRALNPEDLAG